jgi:hypothetical protein
MKCLVKMRAKARYISTASCTCTINNSAPTSATVQPESGNDAKVAAELVHGRCNEITSPLLEQCCRRPNLTLNYVILKPTFCSLAGEQRWGFLQRDRNQLGGAR